jgi:hypothetical protein
MPSGSAEEVSELPGKEIVDMGIVDSIWQIRTKKLFVMPFFFGW